MNILNAYWKFCDDNGLRRADELPEQHLSNIDRMEIAVKYLKDHYLVEKNRKCPTCQGTGKLPAAPAPASRHE